MATLQTHDANILDADAINWRLIVYPLLGLLVVFGGGWLFYYYQQVQRDDAETQARQAILLAKTPGDLVQVADHFPGTTQADFALIGAADLSLNQKNFSLAEQTYQRVAGATGTDQLLRDSAGIGLGAAYEAENKMDEAINAYLAVARRGSNSPYAPYAYASAARLYEQKKDRDSERRILTEAVGLGGDSNFTKEAGARLKMLNATPPVAPRPAPTAPPSTTIPSAPAKSPAP